jgi:integrase
MKSATVKITLQAVKAMQPHTILWDSIVTGFNARRQFSAAVTYSCYFRARDTGKQRFMRIGRHGPWEPASARERAKEILRARDIGADPAGAAAALKTSPDMNTLLDDYCATALKAKKATTVKSDLSRIKTLRAKLGTLKVASINQDHIEKFAALLSAGGRRRTLALLSAIFNFAVRKKLIVVNPVKDVAKGVDRRKTRRLSEGEYKTLGAALAANGGAVQDCILFLVLTGWRLSEARLLRRHEVDADRRLANLLDSKTGASVRPLSAAALAIIARQPEGDSVFGALTAAKIYHAFVGLGLARDVTCHTCRHSFASLATDLGFSDSVVGGMIGHLQSSITSRYLHIEVKLIEAADTVAAETLKLMGYNQ